MGLIWLSQIIRIIDVDFSVSYQILDVAFTTLLAIPSFINPLFPFLVLIGSSLVNFNFNSNNEILILKQYLSEFEIKSIFLIIFSLTFAFFILNNEVLSKKLYTKYKLKELEIRNNLKLGNPKNNEFHIDDILTIFFEKRDKDFFIDVEAIIYSENQIIKSKTVEIELSKSSFNLVFYNGEKLILNPNEKSKTIFNKFIYTLSGKEYETLTKDKDHYSTIELINHSERDFKNHGHNKIFYYMFLIFTVMVSFKVIFFYDKNKNKEKLLLIFLMIFLIQIFNSYLIYLLNNTKVIDLKIYYFLNFIALFFSYLLSNRILK